MAGDKSVARDAHRGPGQRAGLTRVAVLAAARDVLRERGLDALTMRGLADRLGVAPNALYSHVEGKTALIDAVLDDVLVQIRTPSPGAQPEVGLYDLMCSTFEVLLHHSDLVPSYLARQGSRGQHARRLGDIMLVLLADVGLDDEAAHAALRVLLVYTIGFAAFTTGTVVPATELATNYRTGLRWLLAGICAG